VNPKTKLVALGAAAISTAALMMVAAPAQAANKTYTLAAVKAHKSASNCWSAVNGKVYNLTKWVKKHPGGAGVIKSMCGKDATAAFKGQHGLTGKPMTTLAAYRIGTLAKSKATPTPKPSQTSTSTASPSPSPSQTAATLNAALVAKHASASDCWSIVNGNVYNLTAWIGIHPGGAPVIQAMCGIDASAAYTGKHGTVFKPANKLAQYLVGAVGSPAP